MPAHTQIRDRDLLEAALIGYEHMRMAVEQRITQLRVMLNGNARQTGAVPASEPTVRRKRRRSSAATRKRMAEAQRKRGSKIRARRQLRDRPNDGESSPLALRSSWRALFVPRAMHPDSTLPPPFAAHTVPTGSRSLISPSRPNATSRVDSVRSCELLGGRCCNTTRHEAGGRRRVVFRNEGSDWSS
jgi:hypothetical protein